MHSFHRNNAFRNIGVNLPGMFWRMAPRSLQRAVATRLKTGLPAVKYGFTDSGLVAGFLHASGRFPCCKQHIPLLCCRSRKICHIFRHLRLPEQISCRIKVSQRSRFRPGSHHLILRGTCQELPIILTNTLPNVFQEFHWQLHALEEATNENEKTASCGSFKELREGF